ncbi:MAG TPA: ComF family protein, partial [Leucothrix sp.]|nr:ComF family protein [Leucothrix sp.]
GMKYNYARIVYPPPPFLHIFMIPFISSSCVLCDTTVNREVSICDACQADLPTISQACKICGIPLNKTQLICGQCLKAPPEVDYSVNLYHYEAPVDYLIMELKFGQKLSYAAILGFLLKQQLLKNNLKDLPDALLPVPLHKKRLIKRGFNQSLEIAKIVAKELKIPIEYQLIQRNKVTRAQTELNIKQRKRNIKGCFNLQNENERMPAFQHVVIIDDVVTTGATTNELAKVLKNTGVKKVGVWSIARAVLHYKERA